MTKIYAFSIAVVFIICQMARAEVSRKLHLSIYYESNCPDSKSFILHQLQPAMQLLQPYIMLRLIPFGKSKSLRDGYGGFECQHGPKECLGNMVQDCTLNLMNSMTDTARLTYVACEMATEAASKGDFQCVENANLPVTYIEHCIRSRQGTELQLYSEYLTRLVKPKFVPTITIDGVFNQQIQDYAQSDLVGALCSLLLETPVCAQHYNNIALNHILSLPSQYVR